MGRIRNSRGEGDAAIIALLLFIVLIAVIFFKIGEGDGFNKAMNECYAFGYEAVEARYADMKRMDCNGRGTAYARPYIYTPRSK